jgi:arabinogalactan oligomer/maltooligosaccharide transport system permease protein
VKRKKAVGPYLYLTPSIVVIGLIVIFPILYTGYISLTNMNIYHWFRPRFIGLENYAKAIFVFDSGFISALLRTSLMDRHQYGPSDGHSLIL